MRVENGSYKTDNMSYKEYQAKIAMKKKQSITMFLSVFAILLIIFLGVAKILSPDVDITLGDESNQASIEEDYQGGVDSRLKDLQNEDSTEAPNPDSLEEEAGLVKIPKHESGLPDMPVENPSVRDEDPAIELNSNVQKSNVVDPNPISHTSSPASLQQGITQHTPANQVEPVFQPKTYRVYVGMYSNQSQAEVARGILQDSGMGLTPVIKQAAGGYTLQVGAFSKKETAVNLSNRLLNSNYPARVVSD